MKFKTIPYKHQLDEFSFSKNFPSRALFWDMGTGKSKVVIDTAAHLYLKKYIDAVLVVAPNGVAQNWCWKEIPMHMPLSNFNHTAFCYESKRAKSGWHKAKCKSLIKTGALSILVMTYDGFMTKAGSAYVKRFLEKRACLFVLDESQRIKTPGAKRTHRAVAYGTRAHYRRILSGTPVTVNPWDLWPQIKFLSPNFWKAKGFGSLQAFKTYFGKWGINEDIQQRRYNHETEKVEVCGIPVFEGYQNLKELGKIISNISSRVTKEEVLDLPPRVFTQRFVEMTPEQRKTYKQLREQFFIELDEMGETISVPFAMNRIQKFQQILLGFLMDDGKVVHEFKKNPRLDMLCDMLENDISGQAIIWTNYTHAVNQIMERLGDEAIRYDGKVKDKDRHEAINRFQGGQARWLVGNQASGGVGLTLTAGTTMVYYNNSNRPEDRWQSLDRNHRIGQDKTVTVIDLIGGPPDVKLVESLEKNEKMAATICRDELKEWI